MRTLSLVLLSALLLGTTAKLHTAPISTATAVQLCKGSAAVVNVVSGHVMISPYPGYNMSIQTGADPKVQHYVVTAQKGHKSATVTIDTGRDQVTIKNLRIEKGAICVLPD